MHEEYLFLRSTRPYVDINKGSPHEFRFIKNGHELVQNYPAVQRRIRKFQGEERHGVGLIASKVPNVIDIETLTTTITAPLLSVVKEVDPNGPQPPATELTYTVTVTNNGTGVATNVVITDLIPMYITYKAGSIQTGASVVTLVSRTDAADGDGGRYDSTSDSVLVGGRGSITLGPGGTHVMRFIGIID